MSHFRTGLAICTTVLALLVGFPSAVIAQPSPTAPEPTVSGPSNGGGHKMGWLDDVLHGEGIVETKDGPVRVAVQNGTVTAMTGTSVTVRSDDGFTRTWTLDKKVKVLDHRQTLQPGALRTGADIAVGGQREGNATSTAGTYTAKLVLVHTAASPAASPSAS